MNTVVVQIDRDGPSVAFQSDNISVTIIDLVHKDLYTYDDFVCEVIGVNDDGTVNIKTVEILSSGAPSHRHMVNIPADHLTFYMPMDEFEDTEDSWDDEDSI